MPIRDLEWFAEPEAVAPRVLANRGANGIDGVVSTALGVAASMVAPRRGGRRTIGLLGDLAFLHDVSGLVNLPAVPCTFVVVDNGGGGIFSFLPQAGDVEEATFEALFGTPPTSDVVSVAAASGFPSTRSARCPSSRPRSPITAPAGNPGPALIRAQVPSAQRTWRSMSRSTKRCAGRSRDGRPVPAGARRGSAIAVRGHPLAVAAEGQPLGQVDDRLGPAPAERRRIEHIEVAGSTVGIVDDGEHPALVVAASVRRPDEDRL